MNILVTNDDGINSRGLLLLAEALRGLEGYTVFVLAPEGDRSGVSQSISLNGPLRLRDRGNNIWTCSGTPTDCVIAAVLGGLPVKPDLVVSGINTGANLGTDLVYSGTAAAARQAALYGIPGVAFSLVTRGSGPVFWERAAAFSRDHLEELVSLWEKDTFVNVNIPNSSDYSGDPRMTFPSRRRYQDTVVGFDSPDGSRYCFIKNGPVITDDDPGSDWSAISRNRVAISLVLIHPMIRS